MVIEMVSILFFIILIAAIILFFNKKKKTSYYQIASHYVGGPLSFILIHEVVQRNDIDAKLYIEMQQMDANALQDYILKNKLLSQRQMEYIALMDQKQQYKHIELILC